MLYKSPETGGEIATEDTRYLWTILAALAVGALTYRYAKRAGSRGRCAQRGGRGLIRDVLVREEARFPARTRPPRQRGRGRDRRPGVAQ